MHRLAASSIVVLALACAAAPAHAQQTLNFTMGLFSPFGPDARVRGDVINVNSTFLTVEPSDFRALSVGGEWLLPLGNFLEAGAGLSYSQRTVPTVYWDYVDSDGTEVEQELSLRMVPIAFTIRVLPFGQSAPIQPYVGAGIALINWRYTESGEFIDFGAGDEIFEDTFEASGTETSPVILGGVRFAGRRFTAGGEIRYQNADADLPPDFEGSRIDLGGWTYNFTIGVRF